MFIQLSGHTAYCNTAGKEWRAALPTLVLIHGAQNDHSVWELPSRHFANHDYNVLAVDLPGHGCSDGAALTSIEAMAAWLLELLDTIGIQQASLIGHSMGSLIALETASYSPQRFRSLALLGCAYPMKVADSLLTMARDDEVAAIDLIVNWSHRKADQSGPKPGLDLAGNTRRLMQHLSAINPAQLLFTDLLACNQYRQGEQAVASIAQQDCSVLFILAQQDRMTPLRASAGLREALPQARLVQITDCGHAMLGEQPAAVLSALVNFLV